MSWDSVVYAFLVCFFLLNIQKNYAAENKAYSLLNLPCDILCKILFLAAVPSHIEDVYVAATEEGDTNYVPSHLVHSMYTYYKKINNEKTFSVKDDNNFKKECALLKLIKKNIYFYKELHCIISICKTIFALRNQFVAYFDCCFPLPKKNIAFLPFFIYAYQKGLFKPLVICKNFFRLSDNSFTIACVEDKNGFQCRLDVDIGRHIISVALRDIIYYKFNLLEIGRVFYKSHIKNIQFLMPDPIIENCLKDTILLPNFFGRYFDSPIARILHSLVDSFDQEIKKEYAYCFDLSRPIKKAAITVGAQYYAYNVVEYSFPTYININIFKNLCKTNNHYSSSILNMVNSSFK
jgi:hypothetical protein